MDKQDNKPHVLIADDEPANISTLVATLRDYAQLTVAKNGLEALERAIATPPDLLLLDIQMPEINGYDVCVRVRETPALKNIPVIFITTLDAEEDESRGFEVGAQDYITKPFSPSIVLARVKTQYELKRHRDHLEALAEARAKQLVHAERLATLGTLAAGVAHEINNPLSCIMGYAELLLRTQQTLAANLLPQIEADPGASKPLIAFIKDCGEYMNTIVEASDRIVRIVSSMKTYAKRESDQPQLTPLKSCLDNALKLCAHTLKYKVKASTDIPDDLPQLLVRPQQIEQVLINIINNAAHAIESTGDKGLILISARRVGESIRLTLDDTGPGIPPDKLDVIWDAFYTSKGDKGTGLGLSISRGIIEDHHGAITAENRPEGGARFVITLPVPPPDAAG